MAASPQLLQRLTASLTHNTTDVERRVALVMVGAGIATSALTTLTTATTSQNKFSTGCGDGQAIQKGIAVVNASGGGGCPFSGASSISAGGGCPFSSRASSSSAAPHPAGHPPLHSADATAAAKCPFMMRQQAQAQAPVSVSFTPSSTSTSTGTGGTGVVVDVVTGALHRLFTLCCPVLVVRAAAAVDWVPVVLSSAAAVAYLSACRLTRGATN